MDTSASFRCERAVDSICGLNWKSLNPSELMDVAVVYYYFSIQFRENLQIARQLHPEDDKLSELELGECDTDNLSPWPGVAQPGEKMDHDEFMRRSLSLSPAGTERRAELDALGQSYLAAIRRMDADTRARGIASYEDRGLTMVFTAMLTARHWTNATLQAFAHFLREHIRFDFDPDAGHGALARHLCPTDDVVPLWMEFRHMLVEAVPRLAN